MGSVLELDFRMGGAGWADLVVRKNGESREIEGISYLTDALDDIVRLGIAMATDRTYAWAQFEHEPGSTVLIAENGWLEEMDWATGCRLCAIPWSGEHEPTWRGLQGAERKFILNLDSRDELPAAILDAADRIERELGVEGYSRRWTGRLGFPTRAVAALRAALATQPAPEEDRGG